MTRINLQVGKTEKHDIEVSASAFHGAHVQVDGRKVSTFEMPGRSKMVKFSIGEDEVHEVEVRVNGLFLPRIDVLVDGNSTARGSL